MSQVTTFKCDLCGASDTKNDTLNLKIVEVGAKESTYTPCGHSYYLRDAKYRQKEVCHLCRVRLGIDNAGEKSPDQPAMDPAPSLEDMIRMIIREETGR